MAPHYITETKNFAFIKSYYQLISEKDHHKDISIKHNYSRSLFNSLPSSYLNL